MYFTFDRKSKEVGVCSDGANVNAAAYNLAKEDLGEHYLFNTLIPCPAHKFELAVKDAFKTSNFNEEVQKDLHDIFYFFRKVNLKWGLVKQQAQFMGFPVCRFKRDLGTHWVEHQAIATSVYLNNLPVIAGFFNHQIASPYNASMKLAIPKIEGLEKSICKTSHIVFQVVKLDMLQLIRPVSKILQYNALTSPEFITLCQTVINNVQEAHKLLSLKGVDAFLEKNVFPEMNKLLSQINKDNNVVIIERQTCMTAHFGGDKNVSLKDYRMWGSVENALEICHHEFVKTLCGLEQSIRVKFNSIIGNPVIKSAATFLDTKSYCSMDIEELLKAASVLVESFKLLLEANGFNPDALSTEINLLHTHVEQFLSNCSPNKCWQRLFKLKEILEIKNVLHLAEISLVIPLSNAKAECVYSFLWRVYTKE